MKLKRVVLASAVGVVASALFASDQPQPVAATQPTTVPVVVAPAAGGTGVDVGAVARFVREAADPSATVAAYAAAVGQVGTSVVVEDAYVRRMAEFGLPELAEMQAQDVLRRDPNNDVARAVVAYVLGRRGQAVDALANIAQAAGGDRVVADPFVLRTAGQLVAWYDTQADKTQVPEQVRAELDGMRQKLGTQEAYTQAYAAAKEAYEGNAAPAAAPTPVAAAPAPAPVQPQQQPVEPQPAVTTYEPVVTEVTPGPTYYAPTPYEDSYAYSYPMPYAYSGYYYQPIYSHYSYWPGGYRRPYVPPVVIPRDHHHDHGGNDGHGGHDRPGHDGNHGGNGGSGGDGPRVHRYDDVKNNNRLRNDDVVVKRAIEPPVASYPAPPVSTARRYQELEQAKARPQPKEQPKQQREQQQPKQEEPKQQQQQPKQQQPKQEQSRQQRQQEQQSQSRQQRSQSDGGGNSSRRVEAPSKSERRPDPPAARPSPSAPSQRFQDRPGQQQQQSPRQSQPSGGDRGDRGDRKSR